MGATLGRLTSAMKQSYKAMRVHLIYFLLMVTYLTLAVSAVDYGLRWILGTDGGSTYSFSRLMVESLIVGFMSVVLIRAFANLKTARMGNIKVQLLDTVDLFFGIMGAVLLKVLLTLIGLMFVVLPGLYASIVLLFTYHAVALEGHINLAAIKRSHKIAHSNLGTTILVALVMAIPMVLFTLPTTMGLTWFAFPGGQVVQLWFQYLLTTFVLGTTTNLYVEFMKKTH